MSVLSVADLQLSSYFAKKVNLKQKMRQTVLFTSAIQYDKAASSVMFSIQVFCHAGTTLNLFIYLLHFPGAEQ